MKLKVILIILGIGMGFMAHSQLTLDRSIIGSAGSNQVFAGDYSATWTAGETIIGTETNGTIIISQGFQQPMDDTELSVSVNEIDVSLLVFPNPTQDKVTISVDTSSEQILYYSVFNMIGQKIDLPNETIHVFGHSETIIDFQHLPNATYILQVNNQKGKQLANIRIVKM